jgi:hypothetical protein
MRFAPKALIVIATAGALAIAGCGGGDTSTTSPAKSAASQQGTTAQKGIALAKLKAKAKAEAEKKGAGKSQGTGSKRPSAPAPADSAPLPNQGTKAVAPGVPAPKGGDNSIQTYGVESGSEDRVQAASAAKAYLDARAAGRWAEACTDLSGSTRMQLEGLTKQAQGSSVKGCADAMQAFTAQVPKAALLTAAKIHVISMRVQGDQAFLIYRDGENTPSALPMSREGGEWKVAAIAGTALVL